MRKMFPGDRSQFCKIVVEARCEASSPEYNPQIVDRMRRRQARLHGGRPGETYRHPPGEGLGPNRKGNDFVQPRGRTNRRTRRALTESRHRIAREQRQNARHRNRVRAPIVAPSVSHEARDVSEKRLGLWARLKEAVGSSVRR